MKCTFACKKISLNDSIKEYAVKKISKLDRYFREEETSAFVTFSVEKDHLCSAEITIRGGGTLLRAQTEAPDGDMRGAVDAAVGYIERQILKNKTRLAKRLRSEGFPSPMPEDDFEVQEEKEFNIVRTKRFSVKPMSPEEAILQMNLLDHTFFVFRNSEDDSLSIVYQRKNGGYGLIVTDATGKPVASHASYTQAVPGFCLLRLPLCFSGMSAIINGNLRLGGEKTEERNNIHEHDFFGGW